MENQEDLLCPSSTCSDTVTLFLCGLLSVTSLCFLLRSPWSGFIITLRFFTRPCNQGCYFSEAGALHLSIHPSASAEEKHEVDKVFLPYKCSNFTANHPKSAYSKCFIPQCSVSTRSPTVNYILILSV